MISVVVPVYNVEKYLHYAMESLLKQTYKNFEIILVNDGSTDNSGKLCDKYSEKYSNVKVFHKENGGLSDARNFGVKKAKGEFITFLDPDDYLEAYSLELLAGIQEKLNLNPIVKIDDGFLDISLRNIEKSKFNEIDILTETMFIFLKELTKQYPKYIKLVEKEDK